MLADDNVKSIMLDIDSPGGSSEGVMEAGQEIFAGRGIKPIYAIANNMAGSAALWLGSQATQLFTSPSGSVGSIGVFTVHKDTTVRDQQQGDKYTYVSAGKFKTEGHAHLPLTDEGKQYRQEIVDELYTDFVSAVATGRGVDAETVEANYGQGRMLTAKKALEVGLVDGIMEFDAVQASATTRAVAPTRVGILVPAAVAIAMGVEDYDENKVAMVMPATAYGQDGLYQLEVADWEHSDPGTGNPPARREQETEKTDPAIKGGWRRGDEPLDPNAPGAPKPGATANGGSMTDEQLAALKAKLGLKADATDDELLTAVEVLTQESATLKSAVELSSEEAQLKEKFPHWYADHVKRIEAERDTNAASFVASVSKVKKMVGDKMVETSFGLSALASDTIEETHKKFAMGVANVADFENVVKTLVNGGTVDYGEHGSTQAPEPPAGINVSTAEGVANVRAQFAAKVAEIQANDNLDYGAAIGEAAKRNPELAAAYRAAAPA
jgi:signal peptide peptidase SppA